MEAEFQLPHMITLNLSEQLDSNTYLKVELTDNLWEDSLWEITCALPRLDEVPSVVSGIEGCPGLRLRSAARKVRREREALFLRLSEWPWWGSLAGANPGVSPSP